VHPLEGHSHRLRTLAAVGAHGVGACLGDTTGGIAGSQAHHGAPLGVEGKAAKDGQARVCPRHAHGTERLLDIVHGLDQDQVGASLR